VALSNKSFTLLRLARLNSRSAECKHIIWVSKCHCWWSTPKSREPNGNLTTTIGHEATTSWNAGSRRHCVHTIDMYILCNVHVYIYIYILMIMWLCDCRIVFRTTTSVCPCVQSVWRRIDGRTLKSHNAGHLSYCLYSFFSCTITIHVRQHSSVYVLLSLRCYHMYIYTIYVYMKSLAPERSTWILYNYLFIDFFFDFFDFFNMYIFLLLLFLFCEIINCSPIGGIDTLKWIHL